MDDAPGTDDNPGAEAAETPEPSASPDAPTEAPAVAAEADQVPGPPRLPAMAVTTGAGLVLTQVLFVAFTLIEGLALGRNATAGLKSDALHRIGVAFSTSVNIASGLALVAGTVLLATPAIVRAHASAMRGLRTASLVAVQVVAAVIAVGTILGVRSSLHFAHAQGQAVTAAQRWELAAYVAGTLGTAIIAFLAALAAFPGPDDAGDLA